MSELFVNKEKCDLCETCVEACPKDAISMSGKGGEPKLTDGCDRCGSENCVAVSACPLHTLRFYGNSPCGPGFTVLENGEIRHGRCPFGEDHIPKIF